MVEMAEQTANWNEYFDCSPEGFRDMLQAVTGGPVLATCSGIERQRSSGRNPVGKRSDAMRRGNTSRHLAMLHPGKDTRNRTDQRLPSSR